MTGLKQIGKRIDKFVSEGRFSLNEDDAKQIFKQLGMPVVEERQIYNLKAVAQAGDELGYPVVLKGMVNNTLHKSDAGLVMVGIPSRERLEAAAVRMKKRATGGLSSFLVQPMVEGKRELVAGMFRDPQFGPVVMFGLGGVLTEALEDIVFKVPPLHEADLDEMVDGLNAQKIMGHFRGEAAVDKGTLKRILRGLSQLAVACPAVKEVDINPLIVQPDGTPVAVDGLMVLDTPATIPPRKFKIDFHQLNACYYPKTIAFVGASSTPGKWGHMLPANTFTREFKGRVCLVNPKGGQIMGRQVYPSLLEIPFDVDLAVVTVPAHGVIDLIPAMHAKHVKGMLLITSGFREVGEHGRKIEDQLMETAYNAGIIVMGPNTMGMCNPHANFYCTAANTYPIPGATALVCQSGNMGTQLLVFTQQQGIGIRSYSGSGNEAMVTIEDYMEAFERDELTRSVVMYLESVKDGRRFFESASRLSRKKPVVVLKGGRTAMGEQAATSHTGAMASDAKVFDAVCDQAGIIQVAQPMELLDLSAVFSSLPLPKGNRVGIMTLGGGWGVITTDLCAECGLEVPPLSQEIIERLNPILPDFWSHGNPVDIVGEGDMNIPKTCMEELMKWDGCDAVIHLGIHGRRILADAMVNAMVISDPNVNAANAEPFKDSFSQAEEDYSRYMVTLTRKYGKPILGVSLVTDAQSRTLYRYDDADYKSVFFPSPERAVKALAGMVRYQAWLKKRSV